MKKSRIIVIVGPNASGKSGLGVKIAKIVHGEIISADSRQVYRGLNIGSGKITKKEMQGIPHHCIDIVDPRNTFTALDYKLCAQKAILDIFSRGKTPVIVGGTGFYIDAALNRIELGNTPPNPKLRKKLAKKSDKELLAMLKKLDPKRAKTIEQKNPRRLIRAIEIAKYEGSNESFGRQRHYADFTGFEASEHGLRRKRSREASTPSSAAGQSEESKINIMSLKLSWIGIKHSPEEQKKRIHKRLLKRLPAIIREVKKLHANPPTGGGLSWKRMDELGLEYRYVHMYVRGKMEKQEMLDILEREINKYAKRQMTWFKKNKDIKWITSTSSIPHELFQGWRLPWSPS